MNPLIGLSAGAVIGLFDSLSQEDKSNFFALLATRITNENIIELLDNMDELEQHKFIKHYLAEFILL